MTSYAVLLRAVNVGGTGKLPMAELREMCTALGFADVRTYIASGNVVLRSEDAADAVRTVVETRLEEFAGRPVGVAVRTAEQMRAVLARNPFPDAPGNRAMALFLDAPPPADALEGARNAADEQMVLGAQEIYVHYPSGMGTSRLRIPAAEDGTARNMNTVAKLVTMLDDLDDLDDLDERD
ncbi:DUF1697 domain-containing protein [Brachybacterium sp. MASK1Z-5]|uniref:DUF1697 domain-containing protein n=1 Tax=Brachybacterium halotolerans TaxID=2795215 RepID=A0ABS1B881_9MICO|nr:DUF1697 domain-containing protein [Brachybacterium halotolerans]MBK0330848.1 DUF1697 domain-containing protein [Brachybacterium halotolerans]